MEKKEIADKVLYNISNKLGLSKNEVSAGSLFKSIGANSIDIVEIIIDIENEFKINVPIDKLVNIKSVGILVDYVDTSLNNHHKKKNNENRFI
jgi:acyl carrier protein